jgi:hypothetical protein
MLGYFFDFKGIKLITGSSFSNLKPVVRISFCFRLARLYTLHGEV